MSIVESLNTGTPAGVGGVAAWAEGQVWAKLADWAPDPTVLADLSAMLFDEPVGVPASGRGEGRRIEHECGTVLAYRQHLYHRESPDDRCRAAWAAYGQERRERRRDKNFDVDKTRVPTEPGPSVWSDCGTDQAYQRHRYHKQSACAPCRQAHADKVSAADRKKRADKKLAADARFRTLSSGFAR